jgi:hypothetical protein
MCWEYAEESLQQLLKLAVATGLMKALPGGTAAAAIAAVASNAAEASSSSDAGPSSSSSSGSSSSKDVLRDLARAVASTATKLLGCAARNTSRGSLANAAFAHFILQPQLPEVALQLLAAWSVKLHESFTKEQQLEFARIDLCKEPPVQLTRRMGWRMRGDLLLLPDPKQHCKQVMPCQLVLKFCRKDAEMCRVTEALATHLCSEATASFLLQRASSSTAGSSPTLTAAALQLTSYLLLLAAARWQQTHRQLQLQQQCGAPEALDPSAAAAGAQLGPGSRAGVQELQDRLNVDTTVLVNCTKLLHSHILALQHAGQWLPLLQQLQHQGQEMLLQGLTLALHCSRLDAKLQQMEVMELRVFLTCLSPPHSRPRGLGTYLHTSSVAVTCCCHMCVCVLSLYSAKNAE